jgi:tRNA modification GTPase
MADADIVLLVLDATAPLHKEDEAAIAALEHRPFLLVINKSDLIAPRPANLATHPTLETSALTGAGIPQLRHAILSRLVNEAPRAEAALLTNVRQQQAVSDALAALNQARQALIADIPHEMILIDLYEALHALDALTGTTTNDDLLNLIFSKFCIGK